jgi:hypothetical protein
MWQEWTCASPVWFQDVVLLMFLGLLLPEPVLFFCVYCSGPILRASGIDCDVRITHC